MAKATDKKEEQTQTEPVEQQEKLVVINGFSACEDGCVVNTYEPGEYDSLPAVALEHGLAINAFDESSVEFAKELFAQLKVESETKVEE